MNLKGTTTAKNLLKAFAGESQARNRYTYYASTASKEGFVQIANIFLETADNERVHAKQFFTFLGREYQGEYLLIQAEYPIGLGNTQENLKYAAAGEKWEWSHLYPLFAEVAEQEGFKEVALCFRKISEAEQNHERRFQKLYDNMEQGHVYRKNAEVFWKCLKCGYIHKGDAAPENCPACLHPQAYFELFKETY